MSQKSDTTNEKHQKSSKPKAKYNKINNITRKNLLEMVYLKDYHLKEAAKILGINYSTAKTILRIFRIEKRIEKKSAEEERKLREMLNLKFEDEIPQEVKQDLREVAIDSNERKGISNFLLIEKSNLEIQEKSLLIDQINEKINSFNNNFCSFKKEFEDYFTKVKENQIMINNLISFSNMLPNFSNQNPYLLNPSPFFIGYHN